MKNMNLKTLYAKLGVLMTSGAMMTVSAFAADATKDKDPNVSLDGVVSPVVGLLNSLMKPLLAVVGAIGSLYCVLLGVKFAKAEEPQEREKAKSHLKNAIIGFVLIFVLMVVLKLLMPAMVAWVSKYSA